MKRRFVISSVAIAVALAGFVTGCSGKPSGVKVVEDTPEDKTKAPPPTDPGAQMMSAVAGEALKKKSYTEAVVTIVQMGQTKNMNVDQVIEYKNLRRKLQQELADAAAQGDQKAVEAINMLQAMTSGAPR